MNRRWLNFRKWRNERVELLEKSLHLSTLLGETTPRHWWKVKTRFGERWVCENCLTEKPMIYEIPRGVIVLEGPDACGKTTLAQTILARHGGIYRHLRYTGAGMGKRHLAACRCASRFLQDELVVIDRHWLSEQVYGRIYRDGTRFDREARACHGWLKAVGAIYVFCCPSYDSAIARHAAMHQIGRELYKPDDDIKRAIGMYNDAWFGASDLPPYQGDDLFAQFANSEGLQKFGVNYDIDRDGENVVDFADEIVARLMMQRSNR